MWKCQECGRKATHFIRWNPDDYKPKHKNIQPESLTNIHKLVGDLIESILNNQTELPTDSFVSAFYMYSFLSSKKTEKTLESLFKCNLKMTVLR